MSNSPVISTQKLRYVETSPREDLILLTLYGKELYGMEIPQAIYLASNGSRKMQIGSLYPALHSLEEKALVESRWGDVSAPSGGARRRYYCLSSLGEEKVAALRLFWANLLK